MAKRFTDTETWNDPWYRKMPLEAKVFWKFLLDRCDVAGFWKKDYEMASFQCGFEVSDAHLSFLNEGKERIVDHGVYLQIADFIQFQYGELSPDCNPHKPIINLRESYRKKGYLKGSTTLTVKEQDKDKEKEQDKTKGSADFLVNIPKAVISELSEKYKISPTGITTKGYDLKLYCEQKGKRYSNYKSFLENAFLQLKKP